MGHDLGRWTVGFLKKMWAVQRAGLTQPQWDRLRLIKEAADRNDQMTANPAEISMAYFALFAEEHGKADIWELSDEEVGHYVDLMDGIHFPIHPDEMGRAGKFGCEKCFNVYADMWRTVTKPILDEIKRRAETGEEHPMPSPEEMRRTIEHVDEQQNFLNG